MLRALPVLAFASACATEYPPEPFEVADTTVRRCPSNGDGYTVIVSGTVVDFRTLRPIAGAPIDIARAWSNVRFPNDTCAIASTTSREDGTFGPLAVAVPGPRPGLFDSRFLVFLVQGEGLAPLASDNRMSCGSGDCTIENHVIPVPSLDLAHEWRQELRRGGMDHTWTRGLIAFEYRTRSGNPASGVEAQQFILLDGNRDLAPGAEVRYLDGRSALLDPDADATSTSGLALIGRDITPGGTLEIAGTAGSARWGGTGCLIGEGWIFVEDKQQADQ